jgi:transketolase
MPSWRLFQEQSADYRQSVLPAEVTARVAVEAGSPLGWERWVGVQGSIIGIDRFGASAPGGTVLKEYGFTVDHVVDEALRLVGRRSEPSRS